LIESRTPQRSKPAHERARRHNRYAKTAYLKPEELPKLDELMAAYRCESGSDLLRKLLNEAHDAMKGKQIAQPNSPASA
jgi:hypothetical protein